MRHIEALDAQTGPVFLVYRANKTMDELAAKHTARAPDTDFTARDGIRHTSWTLRDAEGHRAGAADVRGRAVSLHRRRPSSRAAAARVFQARRGAGDSAFFLSVIFPDNQLRILPYNRVLKDLNGLGAAELLKKLEAVFVVTHGRRRPDRRASMNWGFPGKPLARVAVPRRKFAPWTDPHGGTGRGVAAKAGAGADLRH